MNHLNKRVNVLMNSCMKKENFLAHLVNVNSPMLKLIERKGVEYVRIAQVYLKISHEKIIILKPAMVYDPIVDIFEIPETFQEFVELLNIHLKDEIKAHFADFRNRMKEGVDLVFNKEVDLQGTNFNEQDSLELKQKILKALDHTKSLRWEKRLSLANL